jgi:hypothetical protein
MAAWVQVYSDGHDRLETLLVPGGYLARNWVRAGSDAGVAQVALVFAPGEPPAPIASVPPVLVDVPAISGSGAIGSQLTATMGNWQNEPTSYSYAWATAGAPNSAIGDTYTVVPGDDGLEITCIVTATNAAGSTAAPPSNAIVAVPAARRR